MTSGHETLLERIRAATVNEYDIDRQIGSGGMATVFLARDIALERPVAIKVMRPELVEVERIQERFVIEARTAAQLGHPGIVTVYAIKQRRGLLFIVMRYIEGRTLEEVLREQPIMESATVASIVSRVADALHFAHLKGIVHRDVKPSNIMIDPSGVPVVTDFGIARASASQGITVAGSMLGTPLYMSPEQCRGMAVTAASDQYSLGVMMYQMLTGRTPFGGEFFELIDGHKNQQPPPIGDYVGGVDPLLEHTVMRMLAKKPEERWPSLADVAQRLTMSTASPRDIEQMQATVSFIAAARARGNTTPMPSIERDDTPPPPTRVSTPPVPAPAPTPAEAPEIEVAASVASSQADLAWQPAISGERSPATPDDRPAEGEPRGSMGRVLIGAAVLAIVLVVFAIVWSGRGSRSNTVLVPVPAEPAPARDTVGAPRVAQPPVQPVAAPTSRDTVPAATHPAPADTTKARPVIPKRGAADSTAARPKAAPTPQECARLLERVSLGEKLTDAEQSLLTGRCRK